VWCGRVTTFRGPYCLHSIAPWRWRQHGLLKCWYPTTTLYGATAQKTSIWIFTTVKDSNLAPLVTSFPCRFWKWKPPSIPEPPVVGPTGQSFHSNVQDRKNHSFSIPHLIWNEVRFTYWLLSCTGLISGSSGAAGCYSAKQRKDPRWFATVYIHIWLCHFASAAITFHTRSLSFFRYQSAALKESNARSVNHNHNVILQIGCFLIQVTIQLLNITLFH